jgi:hypothetical protein
MLEAGIWKKLQKSKVVQWLADSPAQPPKRDINKLLVSRGRRGCRSDMLKSWEDEGWLGAQQAY